MAKTFELAIGYLVAKFLAHAEVFLGSRQSAGTVSLLAAKPLADFFDHCFVGIEIYLQFRHSFQLYLPLFYHIFCINQYLDIKNKSGKLYMQTGVFSCLNMKCTCTRRKRAHAAKIPFMR